jgi:penicillin-binding protein 2
VRIYEDLRVVQSRLAILQALAVAVVAVLVIQFWNLQVLRARHFRDLAENNRYRLVTLAAPRGALLDRSGHVLVGNRPSFNVSHPEQPEPDVAIQRLSRALNLEEAIVRERWRGGRRLPPGVVKTDASLEDVAALTARRLELREVSVDVVPCGRILAWPRPTPWGAGEITDG